MPFKIDTRRLLANSFYELSQKKDLKDITVGEIAQNCGASRATFYRYFQDKYALISWHYENFIRETFSEKNKHIPWLDKQRLIMQFFLQHEKYFNAIIRYDGRHSFDDFLYSYSYQYFTNLVKEIDHTSLSQEMQFAIKIYCYGNSRIVRDWLNKDINLSIEEFCQYRYKHMPEILKQYLK